MRTTCIDNVFVKGVVGVAPYMSLGNNFLDLCFPIVILNLNCMESVILHEFGHTLNLGHFGILQAFTTNGVTTLVYQPVNTMNAYYIGQPRNFLGPNDKGNYCEAWGSWPWN